MALNPSLTALFNSIVETNANFYVARLYTITLYGGGVIRFTDADCDVVGVGQATVDLYQAGDLYQVQYTDLYAYGVIGPTPIDGFTYSCAGVKVDQKSSKTQVHLKIGLDTDTWTLAIMPRPFDLVTLAPFPDMIGGVPWLEAAIGGALDSADFQVDEAYFSAVPTWPVPLAGSTPVGCKTIFAGVVADVDVSNSVVTLTANDYRSLLTMTMPRHFFQGQCRHTLFDSACNASGNMNASSFAVGETAAAGCTAETVISAAIIVVIGSGTCSLGRIVFTSGANVGVQRTIRSFDGVQTLTMFAPLPFAPSAGDTFTVYPGCNKTFATCQLFQPSTANDNFGGQPFIPVPESLAGLG